MVIFGDFRDHGWNTYYGDRLNFGSSFDLTLAVLTYVAVVIAASMAMVVIGSRGKERWTTFLRLIISVHTGVVIVVCALGRYWQVSKVHSHSEFKPGVLEDIETDIGIHVGLKSVNITLHAEKGFIDYNEEFSFNRLRDIRDSYRDGLERGLPRPILHSLEYFYVDGGGLRWHRALRNAGHFTYIILWTSLVTWFISNILLCFILSRGMLMLTLTGCLMVIASLVYHFMQPSIPLAIPFPDGFLRFHYGWCYWLCLSAGILASLIGLLSLVLNWQLPGKMNRFFLVDYLSLADDVESYNFSPGPLKIDTKDVDECSQPFSRRTTKDFGQLNRGFQLDERLPKHRMNNDHNSPTSTQMTYSRSPTSADSETEMQRAFDLDKDKVEASSEASIRCSFDSDAVLVETEAVIEHREPSTEEVFRVAMIDEEGDAAIEEEVEPQPSVLHFEVEEEDNSQYAESVC